MFRNFIKATIAIFLSENNYRKLKYFEWCKNRFGLIIAIKSFIRIVFGNIKTIGHRISEVKTDIYIRPGTSDQYVFDQIFFDKEYEAKMDAPKNIIDAGANIGLASLYFANRFPNSSIISVEPDRNNFEILRKNTSQYDNVTLINAGLWSHKTYLSIENPDDEPWMYRVIEANKKTTLFSYGITDLMKIFDLDKIDVLKLDIEGAEIEVFSRFQSWINKVDTIIVETHDRYRDNSTKTVMAAIDKKVFHTQKLGENFIFRRIN